MGKLRSFLRLDDAEGLKTWDNLIAMIAGAFAILVIVSAVGGGILMVIKMYAGQGDFTGASPLAEIFSSRLMVAAARMAVLFIGVFVVVSVIVHMRRGQWLTAAGPFKVSEAARKLFESVSEGDHRAAEAQAEADRLRASLSDLTTQLRTAEGLLDRAQTRLREVDNP